MEESKHRVESALTDKQEKALIEIEKCHGSVAHACTHTHTHTHAHTHTHTHTHIMYIIICMCRKVDEFQNYSDMDSMLQYCKDVQTVQRRLSEIQEQVNQINKASHHMLALVNCM